MMCSEQHVLTGTKVQYKPLHEPPDPLPHTIPMQEMSGEWYRIHHKKYGAIYYGTRATYRFDDPHQTYGVMYLAQKDYGAFIETHGRSEERLAYPIFRSELQQRQMTKISALGLRLVDLTGAGLSQIGADNRLATECEYETTQLWSRAIYDHPEEPDGILYLSRNDPSAVCAAIFERASRKIQPIDPSDTQSLYSTSNESIRRRLGGFLNRYGFGIDETK